MGCGASKDPARPDAVQMQKAQGAFEAGTLETNKAPTTVVATPRSSGNVPRDTDWARTIEKWAVKETEAGERPNAAEAALADAAAACVSAGKSSPCTNCSNAFAEQWGDDPWHCFKCKRDAPFLDAAVRKGPEETAKKAVVAVDAPFVSTGSSLTAEGEARHAGRAVRVRFLLLLLASLPESERRTIKTGELVAHLIKPATARWRCRFVELPGMRMHIGKGVRFARLERALRRPRRCNSTCNPRGRVRMDRHLVMRAQFEPRGLE